MSSRVTHFSSENIEHLSSSFRKMGREYMLPQGSDHNGYIGISGHVWEDDIDDLKEEDVWGGHRESEVEDSDCNDEIENNPVTKSAKSRKSKLTMELQAAGVKGHKEYASVGFAALEAVQNGGYGGAREGNGGWAPGFSARKVKIPQVFGVNGRNGYANGWHHSKVKSKCSGVPQSAPVSMPTWPVKCGYGDSNGDVDADGFSPDDGGEDDQGEKYGDDGDDGEGGGKLAPHEIVDREYARSRSNTSSVIEGAGRTLKGSDLRRVRNAVWSCTGFED